MPSDLPRKEERRGTRNLLFGGAVVAIVLLLAGVVWPLVTAPELPNPPGYPDTSSTAGAAGNRTTQGSGASTVGRDRSGDPANQAGMKARAIQDTAQPLALSTQQQQELRAFFTQNEANKVDSVPYSISVGASVPQGAQLAALPAKASDILKGYSKDQYVLIRDQLVIVDANARRIVAIIPGIG